MAYDGAGLKVEEVIANGPFDRASSKICEGSVITAINGEEIKPGETGATQLNNIAGKKTLVAFTTPGGEKVEEVILPASSGRISELMYDRWVRQREADVQKWSNGRLGYVHIASMDDASLPSHV